MLLHAVVLVSNLIPTPLTPVAADSCIRDPTEVRIYAKIDPPTTDFTKNEAQLKALKPDGAIAGDPRFTQITGLTVAGIEVDSEVRIANSRFSDGNVCAWPSVVTITLSTSPKVYVTADHSKCQTDAGLTHEMTHVAIDRAIIDRYTPIFRHRMSTMVEAIGTVGPVPESALSTIRHRIEEKINAAIAVATDQLTTDRTAEQRGLDSPTEYERLANVCPQIQLNPGSRLSRPEPKPTAVR